MLFVGILVLISFYLKERRVTGKTETTKQISRLLDRELYIVDFRINS